MEEQKCNDTGKEEGGEQTKGNKTSWMRRKV